MATLSTHFHPSVRHFAITMLGREKEEEEPEGRKSRRKQIVFSPIQYPGDPLRDFTLMAFLERFSYRNPKKKVLEERARSLVATGRGREEESGKRAGPLPTVMAPESQLARFVFVSFTLSLSLSISLLFFFVFICYLFFDYLLYFIINYF